jgi:hypothetical protein
MEKNIMSAPHGKTRPTAVRLAEDEIALVAKAASELSRRSGLRVSSAQIVRLGAVRYANEVIDNTDVSGLAAFDKAA